MTNEVFGWTGKILSVDLSKSKISGLETMAYADSFLGGRGVATRIYWEEVSPEIGALDPGNLLILMNGPLTATGVPGAPRFEVVSKSPMLNPEGFCYGNLGGFFGPYLKRAGYDGIVPHGFGARASIKCTICSRRNTASKSASSQPVRPGKTFAGVQPS
jgi:aldehyde:ferredoxin oxidoreductase